MSEAFWRMVDWGMQPAEFRDAPTLRAFWLAEADTVGGLDDLRTEAVTVQADMFVRQVAGRDEPGMRAWRLGQFEEEMGLPDGSLTGLTDDQRRDRIIARLRAWRLPTANAIRLIALAYADNDVQTTMDYERHNITIRFSGGRLPDNLQDLEAELIRILPARLAPITFITTTLTWGDLAEIGVEWCQLEHLTWDELEVSRRQDLAELPPCAP